MRLLVGSVVLMSLVGCNAIEEGSWSQANSGWGDAAPVDEAIWTEARDASIIERISRVDQPAAGVVFHPETLLARAGMSGITCDVDPESGTVTTDYDFPGHGESVVDGLGDKVLISTSEGLYQHDIMQEDPIGLMLVNVDGEQLDNGWFVNAALVDDGVVAMKDDWGKSAVHWTGDDLMMELPFDGARSELSVDHQSSVVWAAGRDGLWAVDKAGGVFMGPGEHVSWDSMAAFAWVADDSRLASVHPDGSVSWALDLGGEIMDVDAMGDHGTAVVLIDMGGDDKRVTMVDRDGVLLAWAPVHESALELAVSEHAERLAVMYRTETWYYVPHCP